MTTLLTRPIFALPISGRLKSARAYLSRFQKTSTELSSQELIEREGFYRMVIEQGRDAVLLVNEEGIVEFVNPAGEALFCLPADKILGETFEYPLRDRLRQEVCVSRPGEQAVIVDMRVEQASQGGKKYFLAQFRDITELVRLREELRVLSLTDELTGLYNRRAFTLLARQQLKLADRKQTGLYLFFIDIDGMTGINASLGPKARDEVLRSFAGILKESFRSSDLIVRMGGDEFMVLAIDSHPDSRETLVNRLRRSVDAFHAKRHREYRISFSMGTVRYDPRSPCTIEDLMERADRLMYQQKLEKSGSRPEAPAARPLIHTLWDLLSLESLVPGIRNSRERSRASGVTFTLLKDLEEAVQYGLDRVIPLRSREAGQEKEKP